VRGEEVITKLLEFVTSVKVPAVKKFVASDHFKAGKTVDGVKYYSVFGDYFNKHFLPKVEEDVPATDLRVQRLLRNSRDLGIRTEIGENREEIRQTNSSRVFCIKDFEPFFNSNLPISDKLRQNSH